MMAKDLVLKKTGEIATIYFNRPEKRNALTYAMWKEIPLLIKDVEEDRNIKVLIIRGADETSFAAGADISEFQTYRANAEGAKLYNRATHEAERAIATMTKPSIAMVQSYCIGGGLEIALACDFRFSDENGKYGITPAKLGLVYGFTATKQLVDLVGPSRAKYILFSSRILDAHHAQRMGLVDEVFNSEDIVEKTYEFANEICSRAQFVVRSMKEMIGLVTSGQTEENERTEYLREISFDTDDYKEGVQAFLEKRIPKFTFS